MTALEVIASLGGICPHDPLSADLRIALGLERNANMRVGNRWLFSGRSPGARPGIPLDDAAGMLHQLGYLAEHDAIALVDAITDSGDIPDPAADPSAALEREAQARWLDACEHDHDQQMMQSHVRTLAMLDGTPCLTLVSTHGLPVRRLPGIAAPSRRWRRATPWQSDPCNAHNQPRQRPAGDGTDCIRHHQAIPHHAQRSQQPGKEQQSARKSLIANGFPASRPPDTVRCE